MKTSSLLFAALCSLIVVPIAHADSPIELDATPCFAQLQPSKTLPVMVKVQNKGRSVRGTIQVQVNTYGSSNRIYDYPIDLPSGTEKQFIAYPVVNGFASAIDINFNGPVKVDQLEVAIQSGGYNNGQFKQIGMIGDNSGALESIRELGTTPSDGSGMPTATTYHDSYCTPENAPDRSTGYDSVDELVIGEGAERLSDVQWDAIREWVAGGGSLLLLGGSGSLTYLQTPDASALIPLSNLHYDQPADLQFTAPVSTTYSHVGVVTGTMKPGAFASYRGIVQNDVVSWCYGAGLVTVAKFDPTSAPIRGSGGSQPVLTTLLASSQGRFGSNQISTWSQQNLSGGAPYYGGGTTGGYSYTIVAGRVVMMPAAPKTNPFHIKLPDFGMVAWIFIFYFIIVIPVTYRVLKKLNRLELTWITTPIISVAFAMIFYLFTANLYKAGMSHRTSGVLAFSSDGLGGRFVGFSEVFIPLGGNYNIAIPNAETLEETAISDEYTGPSNDNNIETVDTMDGVQARDYSVGNLAFRRFYYTVPVNTGGALVSHLVVNGNRMSGTITNNTNITMTDVNLTKCDTMATYSVGTISSGQTVTVDANSGATTPTLLSNIGPQTLGMAMPSPGGAYIRTPAMPSVVHSLSPNNSTVYVTATTTNATYGLSMGSDASEPASIQIITTLPISQVKSGGE